MTIEDAKVFLDNLKICINEHPVVADWLVEIADRKTENSSEIPNNCEPQTCRNCKWSQTVCRLGDNPPCHSYEPKDEPQTERSSE